MCLNGYIRSMKHRTHFFVVISFVATAILAASLMRTERKPAAFVPHAQAVPPTPSHAGAYNIFLNIAPVRGDRAKGIELLKRAVTLQAAGQHREAIAVLDRAASELPQIADWITAFAASSASHSGDTVEVARRLGSLDELLANEWSWRTRVRAFEKANDQARALEHATLATKTGSAIKRAEAWYRVAELQKGRDMAAHRAALLLATQTSPSSEAGIDAARELHAFDNLSADERIQVGRMLFGSGRYKDASAHLLRISPDHQHAADARFLHGRAQYRLGLEEEGRNTFRSVVRDYPNSSAATRALFFLADLEHDDGDVGEAASLFTRAAETTSKTDESALAMMRAGAIAFSAGDYQKAAGIFDSYRARYPSGHYQLQAAYWSGLTRLRSGDKAAADELFHSVRKASPVSYYGMRAAQMLKQPLALTELKPGPARDDVAQKGIVSGLNRWELLREVGWNEAAAFELRRLKRHFAGNSAALYGLAEELQRRDAPHLAIATGRELLAAGQGWDRRLLRIMYPMPYQTLIERESRKNNLDPYFVAALIRQESSFNHEAVSGAGAIGLMQVMPATGKQLGKKSKSRNTVTRAALTGPDLNVKLGTQFLADLFNTWGERTDAILIAYNAGPTRAYRWRNFPEYASEDLFIERIPFDETRDYVKIVKLNTAIYRFLYGGAQAAD